MAVRSGFRAVRLKERLSFYASLRKQRLFYDHKGIMTHPLPALQDVLNTKYKGRKNLQGLGKFNFDISRICKFDRSIKRKNFP